MKKSGFTLIELIFVIVIIGLLSAVAVPKFLATKKNAETAQLPEIGNQFVNKLNESYQFTGSSNVGRIVSEDNDLKKTLGDYNDMANFNASTNASQFMIGYGDNNETCLLVEKFKEDVNVSATKQVKSYNFRISEVNKSCNQAQ